MYRPDHIALLRGIKALLYDDGLTIKGVQKMLRERGAKTVIARGKADAALSLEPTEVPAETGMLPLDLPDDAAERLADLKSRVGSEAEAEEDMHPDQIRRSIARLEALLERLEQPNS